MGVKGQVEIIAVVVLIVLAIGAVLVTLNLFAVPDNREVSGLGEEKKVIVDSLNDLVLRTARLGLQSVYRHGGVLSDRTVKYGMSSVNLWRDCEGMKIPDMEAQLENITEHGLKSVLSEEMDFYGKDVRLSLGKMSADVTAMKGAVDFEVTIPTEIEGISSHGTYTASVPSRLSEIISFSRDFTEESGKNLLENLTLTSIKHSSGDRWLPLSGVMTGCEELYFLDNEGARNNLEELIRYTLSHLDTGDYPETDEPFYTVTQTGLDIGFIYPSEWDMESSMEFSPNPIIIEPDNIIPFSSECIMPYRVSYSFRYPAVVVIDDPLFGGLFRFGVIVDIEDSSPSETCRDSYADTADGDYQSICHERDDCPARILVKDDYGNPIGGAEIMFDKCYLGETDSSGLLESTIPCFVGELKVKGKNHGVYSSMEKADDLDGKTITLGEFPENVVTSLMGVPVKQEEGSYSVMGDAMSIESFENPLAVTAYLYPYLSPEAGFLLTNDMEGIFSDTLEFRPTGNYIYRAVFTVTNNQTGGTVGYADALISLDRDSGHLYTYLPVVTMDGGGDFTGSISTGDAGELSSLLLGCGIETISAEIQETGSCEGNG